MEFRGHGGVMHFGISEGKKRGLKDGSRPSVGTDIFWNCPISFTSIFMNKLGHNYL